MPRIISIVAGQCPGTEPGNCLTQIVQDVGDTGEIFWTENNGVLPNDLLNYFTVHENGRLLEYPAEYTVDRGVTITSSRINILTGFIGEAFYRMHACYV